MQRDNAAEIVQKAIPIYVQPVLNRIAGSPIVPPKEQEDKSDPYEHEAGT